VSSVFSQIPFLVASRTVRNETHGLNLLGVGLQDNYGPLEITSLDRHPLLAVSRVYTNQRTAGYFEGLPAE
jgi:hypothetical protein